MKTIIHIGVHKTGTSAIQQLLQQNAAELRKLGYLYHVPWPNENNHHRLALMFQDKVEAPRGQAIKFAHDLIKLAEQANCHTIVLSSEVFCENPNVTLIRQAFADAELHALAYLRRPDEILESAYNQVVREPRQRWTTKMHERPAYDVTYQAILRPWLAQLSPAELKLAPYDPTQFRHGSLLDDFLGRLGIVDTGSLNMLVDARRANLSFPPALINLIRISNYTELTSEEHTRFVAELNNFWQAHSDIFKSASQWMLSRDQLQDVYQRVRKSVESLRPFFTDGFDETFLTCEPGAEAEHGSGFERGATFDDGIFDPTFAVLIFLIHQLRREVASLRAAASQGNTKQ